MRSLPKRLLIGLIRLYQRNISPRHPGCCRFIPTCSQYALEAVTKYGAVKGGWMAFRANPALANLLSQGRIRSRAVIREAVATGRRPRS